MNFFGFFRKKQASLTDEQKKWNKMWDLWSDEQAAAPYAQLMTYQSEVNNGGHHQYFANVENTSDLQNEISVLETVLPPKHAINLRKAYQAYLVSEEKGDEWAESILEECDDVFYGNEDGINHILETYAAAIEL